ncbi:hypothetical protein FRACYDRAFT_233650 [Fragilariopsis cylindrus CCMP1102]|uniref:t-SNARE coiled-coil homology domain-containing protein n=1 Tax=Fragilariopsis cylindrus CCMP1102 TaxID=635003 RepID=A0A1E7FZ94_9STRA|nr:hypothetical protein FRACYDRAFT_233650 [Fragilariopsis cylindrus CCMP1102]|eukprot:OEU23482.1 hypothetical protein FRACYDRAFT_233650 [Fragilariopsis cylindrus CCMP1102]
MSFSDFGRHAIAALKKNTGTVSSQQQTQTKRNNHRCSSDSTLTTPSRVPSQLQSQSRRKSTTSSSGNDEVRNRSTSSRPPSSSSSSSSCRRRSDGGAIPLHDHHIHRGVRPRLNHLQCPVTEKPLMDDVGNSNSNDASLASTTSISTEGDYDYDDDGWSKDDDDDDDGSYSIRLNKSTSLDQMNSVEEEDIEQRQSQRRRRRQSEHPPSKQQQQNQNQQRRRLPNHYKNISQPQSQKDRTHNTHDRRRNRLPPSSSSVKGDRSSSINKTKKNYPRESSNKSKEPKQSVKCKLSTEIALFQKMVGELDVVSKADTAVTSPEDMWRSRILLTSAQDANRDLKIAIDKQQQQQQGIVTEESGLAVAGRKKLQRDYYRASEQLQSIIVDIEQRQRAEVSYLTTGKQTTGTPSNLEEEFFDRAMRERQVEVNNINQSMKKVNEIYGELAGLVDDQQEQIDELEDINEEVKIDTKAGLEQIQHGMWKLCVSSGNNVIDVDHVDNMINHQEGSRKSFGGGSGSRKVNPDILTCMMCHGPPGQSNSQSFEYNNNNYDSGPDILDGRKNKKKPQQQQQQQQHPQKQTPPPPHDNHERWRDDDESVIDTTRNSYYDDDTISSTLQKDKKSSPSPWKNILPLSPSKLENLQENVKESAQDAYQRGQTMVGDIVDQVQEAYGGAAAAQRRTSKSSSTKLLSNVLVVPKLDEVVRKEQGRRRYSSRSKSKSSNSSSDRRHRSSSSSAPLSSSRRRKLGLK